MNIEGIHRTNNIPSKELSDRPASQLTAQRVERQCRYKRKIEREKIELFSRVVRLEEK